MNKQGSLFIICCVVVIAASLFVIFRIKPKQQKQTLPEWVLSAIDSHVEWCHEQNRDTDDATNSNDIWVYANHYSGMHHGPSEQYVCQSNNELFSLHMEWNDAAIVHTGYVTSFKTRNFMVITSTHKDPNFSLMQEKNLSDTENVWFTVDDNLYRYNIPQGTFEYFV